MGKSPSDNAANESDKLMQEQIDQNNKVLEAERQKMDDEEMSIVKSMSPDWNPGTF